MNVGANHFVKLYSGTCWIDVHAKLLSNKIIIAPSNNTAEFEKIWNKPSKDIFGKLLHIILISPDIEGEKTTIIRIQKDECCGLGVSIKGGRDFGSPILVSKIFKVNLAIYAAIFLYYVFIL